MSFSVFLTDHASKDLQKLNAYIKSRDGIERANRVLDQIEKKLSYLSTSPARGTYPKELLVLGIQDFREIFFKSYRIIYRVIGKKVFVFLIVDGRRDLQTLLQQRLLET